MKTYLSNRVLLTWKTIPWIALLIFGVQASHAQFTISTETGTNFTGGNGVGGNSTVTFVIRNNNPSSVLLTGVDAYWQTANTNTSVVLWQSTTSLGGAATVATPAWQQIATAGPISVPSNGYYPTLTGLNLVIPANTSYRFALQSSAGIRYSGNTPVPSPSSFSANGVDLMVYDANVGSGVIGYGGAFPTPPNQPRAFTGRVHISPLNACSGAPSGGTAAATPTLACQGGTTTLSLTGTSVATGLSYQWFHSSDDNTYNIIAGATSATYVATVPNAGNNYFRCTTTCSNGNQSSNSSSILVTGSAQLSGNYTINNTLPTGGTNFNNFQDAFSALACGSNGPVFMNVSSGQTFTSAGTLTANFTGSLANPIIFQKSGAGANPSIAFTGGSGTTDAGLRINGSDYITWDGINLIQGGTTTADWIEYGLYVTKSTGSNGASNNTFKNFSIDLGSSTGTTLRGVFMDNVIAATDAGGGSNNNNFKNLTITNVNSAGVWLAGSATSGFQDLNNKVDGCNITLKSAAALMYGVYISNQDLFDIKNNTIGNYNLSSTSASNMVYITGGTTTTNGTVQNNTIENVINAAAGIVYGIQVFNGGNYNITQNTIRNLSTTTTVRGIYLNGAAATTSDVHRNRIYGITSTSATTTYAAGIQSNPGVNRLYNNMITGIIANTSTATPGVRGIDITGGASQTVYNNTVIVGGSSASSAALAWSTTTIQFDVRNNIFVNNSTSATFAAAMYRSTAGNPNFAAGSNNNLYFAGTPSATRPIYRNGTTSVTDLGSYLGLGVETVAYTENLAFTVTNGEVAINQSVATYVESGGQDLAIVTNDYYGTSRGAYPLAGQQVNGGTSTDVGAEENNFLKNVPATVPECATLNSPANNLSDICVSHPMTLSWTPSITGSLASEGYDVFFGTTSNPPFVTNVSTTTYNVTGLVSGQTYYWSVQPKNDIGNATGCSVFSFTMADHEISGTTPGQVCGVGTVNLSATASSGTVNWFANATGGAPIGTGNNFTTPSISSTTTYYAAAVLGGSAFNTSKLAPEPSSTGTVLTTYGQIFTADLPFTLNSVQVFSTTGTSITISLYNSAGTTQLATTGSVPVVAGSSPIIPLNFNITPGTYRLAINGMTGNFIRDNTGVTYPIALANGIGSVLGFHSSLTGAVTTSSSYYFAYNWNVSTGCESSRVPVVATVNAADAVSINPSTLNSCTGEQVTLTASSANTNYTYTWMPGNLSGASVNVNPTSTTTYTVTGTDGVCSAQEEVTITVSGAVIGTISPNTNICGGGSTTITTTGTVGDIQWQSFNGTWNNIVGQTSATINVTPVSTTQYRAAITVPGCPSVFSNTVTVTVTNVDSPTVQGATICGLGTANLSASVGQGTINWWANPTGGAPLATGTNFTTPAINSTTTYYASAIDGGSTSNMGRLAPNTTGGVNLSNYLQHFTVNETITLNSVQVFSTTGTAVTISLYNSTGSTLIQTTGSVPVTAGTSPNITLGWNIPAGTYRIGAVAMTGSFIRENPASPGFTYPIPLGTVGQINGYNTSITGALTTNANVYYYVYNWNITTGCESPRVPVVATVTSADAIVINPSTTNSCTGEQVTLSASSANTNYTYSWTPGNLTGASVNVNPTSTTTYTVMGTDGLCTAQQQVTINVNGAVLGTISGNASICSGSSSTITLTGSVGDIQWQSFNGTWNNIAGQNGTTLTVTPTSTTQYRAAVGFTGCPLAFTSPVTITVNAPQVVSVQGQNLCTPGAASVSATPSVGSTITWYDAPVGGNQLGTGNTLNTTVTGNSTFYAQANTGTGSTYFAPLNPSAVGTFGAWSTSAQRMQFTVLQELTIESVDMFFSAALGSAFTVVITDASNNVLFTHNGVVTVSNATPTVPQTVNLNATLAPGNYGIRFGTGVGSFRNSTGAVYPYTLPGLISITGNTFDPNYYYLFYNWKVSSGCESPRVPVSVNTGFCQTSQLISAHCGATGVAMTQNLLAVNVTAPAYRFRIQGANTGVAGWNNNIYIYDAPAGARNFRFQFIPGSIFGSTYVVSVAVGDGLGNFGPYGASCNVTLASLTAVPLPTLESAFCGATVSHTTDIKTPLFQGALAYRFRINGGQEVVSADRQVKMSEFSTVVWGQTYSVDVAVQSANGSWSGYGTPCNVTVSPTTQLEVAQCNIINVQTATELKAVGVSGAIGFRFRITGPNNGGPGWVGNVFILDRPNRVFTFNMVPGSLQGEMYTVEVAASNNSADYAAYGSVCNITLFGTPQIVINDNEMMVNNKTMDAIVFGVNASHNPFSVAFGLQVLNANDSETINVAIYDMSGKLIESHEVNPMDIENVEFGSNLASGMYMIEVKQGTKQATIRQVKN